MTLLQAIKLMKEYQQWRLGAEIPMPDTKKITQAIDILIKYEES